MVPDVSLNAAIVPALCLVERSKADGEVWSIRREPLNKLEQLIDLWHETARNLRLLSKAL